MKYTELNELIVQLQAMVEDANPEKGYWGQLWTLVKEIGGGFKETRYPMVSDKNEAWTTFQQLREQAEKRSVEQRKKIEHNETKWAARKQDSGRALGKISWHASQARPLTDLERSIGDLILLPLIFAERILNDILGIDSKDSLFSIKAELQSCGEELQ